MRYKVLWIDDEYYTTGSNFIGLAEQLGVDIIPFGSHKEGMDELKATDNTYEAVILDVKGKLDPTDNKADSKGFWASTKMMIEHNVQGYLPCFTFTGQPDYYDNDHFREMVGEFYVKGKDDERLIEDVIRKIEDSELFKVKKQYSDVLRLALQISSKIESNLIDALLSYGTGNIQNNGKDLFTALRKCYEGIFERMYDLRIMPKEVFQSSLNQQKLFVINRHNNIAEPVISVLINCSLEICNDGSHDNLRLPLGVDNFLSTQTNSYLYQSVLFQVIEVVRWAGLYIQLHLDPEINEANYIKQCKNDTKLAEWFEGTIIQIHSNGFGHLERHAGGYSMGVPPAIMSKNGLVKDSKVRFTIKLSEDGSKDYIDKIEAIR